VKISDTVIEILTFNKWSSKVYRFQKRALLLRPTIWPTFHGVDSHVSIDAISKKNKVFITKDLVWINILVKKKVVTIDEWSHCFIGDNCERVVSVVTETYVLTCNWKHVIKYDFYVKFLRIFACNVQICATFSFKNFSDVCPAFWILHHYTLGALLWTRCRKSQVNQHPNIEAKSHLFQALLPWRTHGQT